MSKQDIIAIGGSAGSTMVVKQILAELPGDFPGSLFVTVHVPSTHPSHLAEILAARSPLKVAAAVDGQPVEPGHAYIAVPDRHLLIIDSTLRLGAGPRENMVRPSIDPMFRSAALSYGSRAVGVILSGLLNDGASGLFAIKSSGGVTVAQHPADAAEDAMPRAALEAVEVDHVARGAEIADLLQEIVRTDAGPQRPISDNLLFEVEVANGAGIGSEPLRRFAQPTPLTCPDCGGVLSEVWGEQPLRFRCQIGHAYTAEQLSAENDRVDEAVQIAMRIMEERAELVRRMARDAHETGRKAVAELYERRAEEYGGYAETLRQAALLSLRMGRRPDAPDG